MEAFREENEQLREQLREAQGRCVVVHGRTVVAMFRWTDRSTRHLISSHLISTIVHSPTPHRAEEAEGNLARVLEDQRSLLRRERRREREAQLERMRAFEAQLEAAMGKFRVTGAELARVAGEAAELKVGRSVGG